MRKSFKYKVARMSPSTVARAERQLDLLRHLYNAALQERRDAWKKCGVRVTCFDQMKQLTEIRADDPGYREINRQATERVLVRLDEAFDGFFRRCAAGERPGYPRFKGRAGFNSTVYRQSGWRLDGRTLRLAGIGAVKLFLSRPVEGRVKTVTLARDRCGDWWVTFACDGVPERALAPVGRDAGIDVGLESFLTTDAGESVANPRHLGAAVVALTRASRRVSRRKRGGYRRRQAVRSLARTHRRVQNARRDFHFKTARHLVQRHDLIAAEALNVRGLSRGRLAKSVNDAGWGQFLSILAFKAEEAGRRLVLVDPRGTSQVCSGCGCEPEKRKTLRERTHRCEHCGLTIHRDVNAARNILELARAGPAGSRPRSQAAA